MRIYLKNDKGVVIVLDKAKLVKLALNEGDITLLNDTEKMLVSFNERTALNKAPINLLTKMLSCKWQRIK